MTQYLRQHLEPTNRFLHSSLNMIASSAGNKRIDDRRFGAVAAATTPRRWTPQRIMQPDRIPQPPRHNLNIPLVRLPIPPDRLRALLYVPVEHIVIEHDDNTNATHQIKTRYPRQRTHEPLPALVLERVHVQRR